MKQWRIQRVPDGRDRAKAVWERESIVYLTAGRCRFQIFPAAGGPIH